eukprot:12972956-Alexandrium_andersonii.AAC.1
MRGVRLSPSGWSAGGRCTRELCDDFSAGGRRARVLYGWRPFNATGLSSGGAELQQQLAGR